MLKTIIFETLCIFVKTIALLQIIFFLCFKGNGLIQ